MITVLSALFVLSLLIIAHEWGHFLAARLLGVRVLIFSVGFGPKLFGVMRGETEFRVSAVPLGGYVKLLGEGDEDFSPADRPFAFSERPLWQKAFIVAAGPVFNLLLAWVIFTAFFLVKGKPVVLPEVGQVVKGSPAEKAGLAPKDLILEVNGKKVNDWETLTKLIRESGAERLTLKVRRGDRVLELVVRPQVREIKDIFGETKKVPVIGIVASGKIVTERIPPWSAFWWGLEKTFSVFAVTVKALIKLIERAIPLSSVGGPLLIAQMAGEQAKQGFMALLLFSGILSVNLAIINLLPIPMLDGGHLFLYAIEGIRGRPLSPKTRERIQKVGLAFIIALSVLVFYNDLLRILPRWMPGLLPR